MLLLVNIINIIASSTVLRCSLVYPQMTSTDPDSPVRCLYLALLVLYRDDSNLYIYTHTHPLNGHFSRTARVSRYQKGKNNLDFIEAGDSEWQWLQLGHMQVCI